MSSPISSNTTNAFFYEDFEDVKITLKEHAKVTLEKTSDQVKLLMKEKVDEQRFPLSIFSERIKF
jgi:hypothetical protein